MRSGVVMAYFANRVSPFLKAAPVLRASIDVILLMISIGRMLWIPRIAAMRGCKSG
jgi:hypothetical protein